MPRNGSGTYTLPAGNPVFTGTTISSTVQNNTTSDIASALTQSIAADGQTPITANIPFNGNKITGLGAATAMGQALSYGQSGASLAGLTSTNGMTISGAALTMQAAINMVGAAINGAQSADVASASTTDLDTVTGDLIDVTGTTTINAITLAQGHIRVVRFTGILTLTNGASLVLPGGRNKTTAAGDFAIFAGYASSVVRMVAYSPAVGTGNAMQTVTGTVATNALTAGYSGGTLEFRSATIGSGTVTPIAVGSISLTVASGATLGTSNGVAARLWLAVINNAGTPELAIINTQLGNGQIAAVNESTLISTTALSGSSNTAGVWYSTSARSGVPFRLVGYLECTEATAGTWATAPAVIQGMSLGTKKPGDLIQVDRTFTTSVVSGSTAMFYDNTIPQNTEGDQYLSQAITPTSAINTLFIDADLSFAPNAAGVAMIALFQDSTANAISGRANSVATVNAIQMGIHHVMQSGTASSTTFKIRAGINAAAQNSINAQTGAGAVSLFGGAAFSWMNITEVMA